MGFPTAPADGDVHTEGTKQHTFVAAANTWVRTQAAATATSVSVAPAGNLTSTNVQAALQELQGDVDALQSVTGQYLGAAATSAALDALPDVDGSPAIEAGDWAYLTADEGGREAGVYVHDGTGFGATPVYQFPDSFTAADAILSDTLAGAGGTATTLARSDHRHAQSRGAVLPATDGSEGVRHILVGHATLPDDDYWLNAAGDWVQN